jgi:hypothetical protein
MTKNHYGESLQQYTEYQVVTGDPEWIQTNVDIKRKLSEVKPLIDNPPADLLEIRKVVKFAYGPADKTDEELDMRKESTLWEKPIPSDVEFARMQEAEDDALGEKTAKRKHCEENEHEIKLHSPKIRGIR